MIRSLRRIAATTSTLDPGGLDRALRLTVSFGLYAGYDALRGQERPMDRQMLADRFALVEAMLHDAPGRLGGRSPSAPDRRHPEEVVAELYSRCWSHYDDRAFLETVDLFAERFHLNRVDLGFLQGADCLDAGCGSGRYTMAMARLGAKQSIGIDISPRAIDEATSRSRGLGVGESVRFCRGSVLDMPREWTETFDFVCSNGVAHHTTDPTRALREIFRVLKPGGRAYVFVYGSGGVFWEIVDVVRALVAPVPMAFADRWLQCLGLPPGKVFNFMDHWYTPIQERVSQREFEARLQACGFEQLVYLPRAKIYDASERRFRFPEERDLVGDGDLRYLVEKPGRSRTVSPRGRG